jgi:hypothetical protein
MSRRFSCSMSTLVVLWATVLLAGQRATAPASPGGAASAPAITSPKQRDSVPRRGIDPPCKQGPGCSVVNVEGKVAPGTTPFLAVAPLQATPKIWIQPKLAAIHRDGTFEGIVYLGTEKLGIGERYSIYVFACRNGQRFGYEDVIEMLPTDCVVSDPVTVTRTQ